MASRSGAIAIVALLAVSACGNSTSSAPPSADEPAGEVIELIGTVSSEAEAAGKIRSRPLVVGDKLLGSETVVTGADSSVVIRLYHNEARWTLGASKRRRVNQSAAWRVVKGAGGDLLAANAEDRTTAAGRHSERRPPFAAKAKGYGKEKDAGGGLNRRS